MKTSNLDRPPFGSKRCCCNAFLIIVTFTARPSLKYAVPAPCESLPSFDDGALRPGAPGRRVEQFALRLATRGGDTELLMVEARDGCASALVESAAAVATSQRIGGQPGQPLAMRNDVLFYLSTRCKAH